jgi:hypothetical protein
VKRRREARATHGWKCLFRRTGNPSVEGGDTNIAAVKTWGHETKILQEGPAFLPHREKKGLEKTEKKKPR